MQLCQGTSPPWEPQTQIAVSHLAPPRVSDEGMMGEGTRHGRLAPCLPALASEQGDCAGGSLSFPQDTPEPLELSTLPSDTEGDSEFHPTPVLPFPKNLYSDSQGRQVSSQDTSLGH